MAKAVSGVVIELSERAWPDKETGQPVTLHSYRVDSTNMWFRTGTRKPRIAKGDFITFAADDKGNVRLDSIENQGPKEAAAADTPSTNRGARAASSPTSGQTRSAGGRDDYWKQKEERDIEKEAKYQAVDVPRMSFSASQERAVNLVAAALAHDVLSFGTVKKGDKLDMLLEFVDQVTDRFFLQSMGAGAHLAALADTRAVGAHEEEYSFDE